LRSKVKETVDTTFSMSARDTSGSPSRGVGRLDGGWTIQAAKTTRRVTAYALTVGALLLLFFLLQDSTWRSDAQIHTLLEVTATTLALAVGVVASMRYFSRRETAMLYVGAAFLGAALLDGYHAVVTSTYFSEAFPSTLSSLIPWSWGASRLFLSVFLFLSWSIWWKSRHAGAKTGATPTLVFSASGVAVLVSFTFFALVPLPQAHHSDLILARPQELIPALFFLLALIGYLHKAFWRSSTFAHWLVLSLIVGFVGQAIYMSSSAGIFDAAFDAAHALKILSYGFVLTGLLISIFQLFQRAGTFAGDLALQAVELEEARDAAVVAVEARSRFLANVSHEIRTPMNAILGMTELALSTELSVEQREYLGTSRTSVEALIKIVNDLLDLSKIEAEKLELDSVPFSLGDTVSDTMRALSVSASAKGVGLQWDMPEQVPDSVVGDPGRLRQVLVNLIGNAIKFTPEGDVDLVVNLEDISDDEAILRFEVRDTGIGIPSEKLEHVFEAFSQADASTTRRFGGTGLGLTISAQLVELMGGTMWAESTPGVGTAMYFTARLGLYDHAGKFVATATPGDNPPVVVIVDEGDEYNNLVEMLTQGNIEAIIATSDEAAAAALRKRRPGPAPRVLLVADSVASLSRFERIMSEPTLSGLSVIALASVGRRGDAADYRRVGLSGYLTRPVLQTDLLEAVGILANDDLPENMFVTIHSLRELRPTLNVLLADDSPTNRQLAVRLLELRGHSVEAVEDGKKAFNAWKRGTFDVILMDVQMPQMDGIETTAAIREQEGDGQHIPIVALTAFATDSDRERCLIAGMDSYVSKPFRAEQLYGAIESFGSESQEAFVVPSLDDLTTAQPVDHRAALEIVGGSTELLAEIATIFMEEHPGLMESINDGFTAGDRDAVMRASHRLKGSLAMLAAVPAQRAAQAIEDRSGAGDMVRARDAYEVLRSEMVRLQYELVALGSTNSALPTSSMTSAASL